MNQEKQKTNGPGQDQAKHCATGGCGGAGMCPGTAMMIAFAAGVGVMELGGASWLAWTLALPLFLLLVTGQWRVVYARLGQKRHRS